MNSLQLDTLFLRLDVGDHDVLLVELERCLL